MTMNRETTAPPDERTSLALEAVAALETAAASVERALDRHAGGFGLSDAKLEVLDVLVRCGDRRACLCDLGQHLRVTRPNVTKLVDGLERGGLVERLPHPQDGRMVQAHLTPDGEGVAARALPGRQERIERVWDELDDEELRTLIALLRRCRMAEGA
jgi:DNA-binding MarR family transcriptional regulator